jgi:hypothetical protein
MRNREGYATAAFMIIAFGIAGIAATLVVFANAELRAARLSMNRVEERARLEGNLVLAADTVMRESQLAPLFWSRDVDGHKVVFLAEPEAGKASATDPAVLGSEPVTALAADAPLTAEPSRPLLSLRSRRDALVGRSSNETWRQCAPSYLSPLSSATTISVAPTTAPTGGAINWRVGEVWRLVAYSQGRAADALVRFTGDPDKPMAILDMQIATTREPDPKVCADRVAAALRPAGGRR